MKPLQTTLALLTLLSAVVVGIASHVVLGDDTSALVMFVLFDGPLLLTMLAACLALAMARGEQYEFAVVLMVATLFVGVAALLSFLVNPLLIIPWLLLLFTTVLTGVATNRAWRTDGA